jgi:AcrR family transcriptional regulator
VKSLSPAPPDAPTRASSVRKHAPRVRKAGADDRSRQARGDRRRRQILDAAVALFAAKGYRGTGVAALAERVGMTATGLLYYFGSKERLLHEVVAERDRADAPEAGDLTLDGLRGLGRHNVETALLTRLYAVLTAENLDPSDPLHDFFVERYETARALVRTVLEDEIGRGAVRPDVDAAQVAQEVIGVLMGLEIQWLVDPARVDLAGTFDRYVARLERELAAWPDPAR